MTDRVMTGVRPPKAVEPGSMRPTAAVLPDTLPTDRLGPGGRPLAGLRAELYRIPVWRNLVNVVSCWVQSVGIIVAACLISTRVPLPAAIVVWMACFLLMGRAMVLFSILTHEAAHRLLFPNRRINDLVGRWLLGAPAFLPMDAYRRGHMAHHREEFGPNEPDLAFYAGYPITRASWRRKLCRDALGVSGWKNLRLLFVALRSSTTRPIALRILMVQVLLAVGLGAGLERWWLYPLMWLAPWMTVWRVLNRLRSVAEHGGLGASPDRRLTTHHVRQSVWARFWIVPFNTGWHLAHHVDIGVPFQRLPALHRELEAAGWVTAGFVWPSYRALWRWGSSAGSQATVTGVGAVDDAQHRPPRTTP